MDAGGSPRRGGAVAMRLRAALVPAIEFGRLRASATFQDPDVRLVGPTDDDAPTLRIAEGGVEVELEFPDRDSLLRFQRRLSNLSLPPREGA